VANVSRPERLADQQYVTLILRLLVDRQGQIIQGEIGGLEGGQDAARWVRFRGAEGLLQGVHTWLAASYESSPGSSPGPR
jgi:hypothetical protein